VSTTGAAPDGWAGPVRTFPLVVEQGTVTAFCQAIGRTDEAHVPPTFAVVADRFDPAFTRRPAAGKGWPDGPPETMLHVEQWFELGEPLVVGEELVVRRGLGRTWEKQGRSGRLTFLEERTELVDDLGVVRVATGWVDVRTEAAHRDLTTGQRDAAAAPVVVPPRADEVVLAEGITPTHLVRYIGAAGDWHPLHHDRAMAQALGYPDVFAPGMLTMALTAEALEAHLDGPGRGALVRLASRFRAQVWPGDSLFAAVTDHGDGTLSARTRNQFDEVVLETTAATA
jgi:acyl dehydratase